MKDLNNYITEKILINKDTKVNYKYSDPVDEPVCKLGYIYCSFFHLLNFNIQKHDIKYNLLKDKICKEIFHILQRYFDDIVRSKDWTYGPNITKNVKSQIDKINDNKMDDTEVDKFKHSFTIGMMQYLEKHIK